ncbi:MAG: hypothetical protein D6814_02770 [Calditrichaeota bacterium]|nr:MAG: hypothetical protein D6814_02770 [Calditrichota bacterium]
MSAMIPFAAIQFDVQKAAKSFTQRGFLSRSVHQPEKIDLLYLPHYIFTVETRTPGATVEHIAVDAIHGEFSYYLPQPRRDTPESPGEIIPFVLSRAEAQEKALEGLKRALLQASLKRGKAFEIQGILRQEKIYLPFWLAYFRKKHRVHIAIIDALEGRPQGSKVKRMVLHALSTLPGSPAAPADESHQNK